MAGRGLDHNFGKTIRHDAADVMLFFVAGCFCGINPDQNRKHQN
jgi:hypothetical protein